MNEVLKWYLDFIQHELEKLEGGRFTGNIEFKVNLKEGGIANLNCVLNRSVKLVDKNNIEK